MKTNLAAGILMWLALAASAPAAEPGSAGRVVRHAMGESTVPARALRVVTLTYESTEAVLALGLVPVGAVDRRKEKSFYPQVAAALTLTRPVGDEDAPDLVAIAALHPDLILGVKLRHAALYPRLSEIAPTVFCETLRGEWRDNFRLWATALGRNREADEAMSDWKRRVAAAKRRWPGAARTRVAVLRFMPATLRIYHDRSFAVSILREIGCQPDEFQAGNDFFEPLPLARLAELDSSDAIVYFTWDDGTGSALQFEQAVTASNAWRSLPAVRNRHSFHVDDGIWNTGGNLISSRLLLDELVRLLAPAGN
jgi:iron complex transport system substrate-binding protein